jgi:hypothetical protein
MEPYLDNVANVPNTDRYVIAMRPTQIYHKGHFIVPLVGLAITLVIGIGVASFDQRRLRTSEHVKQMFFAITLAQPHEISAKIRSVRLVLWLIASTIWIPWYVNFLTSLAVGLHLPHEVENDFPYL